MPRLAPQDARSAKALFDAFDMTPEERILATMSFEEADPALRRLAFLYGGFEPFLKSAFLDPMLRWGASESFRPIREIERARNAHRALAAFPTFAFPWELWKPKSKTPPAWGLRVSLWMLLLVQSPSSLLVAIPAIQWLASGGSLPEWALGLATLLAPIALGLFETRVAFKRWPWLNPARWIVANYIAPGPARLREMETAARECFSAHAIGCAVLARELACPDFSAFRASPHKAPQPFRTTHDMSLWVLHDELKNSGRNPSVDAAIGALARQERSELQDCIEVPAEVGSNNQPPSAKPKRKTNSL